MIKKEEASDRQNKQGSKREIAHACQEKLTDYMKALTNFTEVLSAQVQAAARHSDETQMETPVPVRPGDWVRVRVHKRKWPDPRWTGPWEVTECTSHAIRVKGRTGANWHHLSHCVPTDRPSLREVDSLQK